MAPHPCTRARSGPFALTLALLLSVAHAAPARAGWAGHGGDAQHTALTSVPTQPLERVVWQTPVDLNPQYSGTTLFIHYGSPLITEGNTVLVAVKTGVADTFRVEARRGSDGGLLWQLDSDYLLPAHNWVPSFGATLARDRVYLPAAGGTLLWTGALNTPGAHTATRVAFYGAANYASDPAAFDASLRICTPLTSDSHGNVYFGVRASGVNPLGIVSGIARVDAAGNGLFVSAAAASAGASSQVLMNCAPALSADEQTLYIATRGSGSTPAYLLALATATLSTVHSVLLMDPVNLVPANALNDGTASPMVAPDGRVYFGVFESPFGSHSSRGWLLQFDAALSPSGPPGSFGWDDTPSLVPAASVPSYAGTSSYLLMTKYNYYAGAGGGDGLNRLAIVDPNNSQLDLYSATTVTVMKEVATILGLTHDDEAGPGFPLAVREWCINTAVVDPYTRAILAGAEDGRLYRWNLATNTFSEVITLTPGLGEAYTPTVAGPDGQVYAINNATLFAVGRLAGTGVPTPGSERAAVSLAVRGANPFSNDVALQYTLAHDGHATLDVLDLAGQRVVRLQAGVQTAGTHLVRWDGHDAGGAQRAPGVYFARLATARQSVTVKLLLLE